MRAIARALAAGALLTAAPLVAQRVETGLDAAQIFAAAATARANGATADALAFYQALTQDRDVEIRTEARFRMGLLLADEGRLTDAAVAFRAILDEKPGAARVRLELARVLAFMGDQAGARRAVRQAQGAGLPPDVAVLVDQFAAALRSTKRLGGSVEVALAPDTNINRATSARTLDTIVAPLTLSQDARSQSGVGVRVSAQGYGRLGLTEGLSLLPRGSVRAALYRGGAFNDVSTSALVGVEWRTGRDQLTASAGRTWRWFGGRLNATTDTLTGDWLHPLGRRAQLTVSASAGNANYRINPLQSGGLYDLSVGLERALGGRAGFGATLGATRQAARDPGYATAGGGLALFGYREVGRTTIFGNAQLRRLEGDERLFLFPERRREWLTQGSLGATFRSLTVRGFAPLVRIGFERNTSTVGLYDYRRATADIGIARAF